uniref:ORF15 n=1 Tax=Physarum polycephalum TaxID=5791 RepID=Q9MJ67_PHYPO|nr:hypothetical protein PhpooMp16 [Physarum polycephalum]BAB08095.1 unnamed protein product [Physarum polycephalum]
MNDVQQASDPSTVIQDPLYLDSIKQLDIHLSTFLHNMRNQFRNAYTIHKSNLNLLKVNLELQWNTTYEAAIAALFAKIWKFIPSNITQFTDLHYFLKLLVIFTQGPHPTDVSLKNPLFTPKQLHLE